MNSSENSTTGLPVSCKFCGSPRVLRNGHKKQAQYWLCSACGRAFIYNHALPRMRYSIEYIGEALAQYYSGLPISRVRVLLRDTHHRCPSYSTLYLWIMKFTASAVEKSAGLYPVSARSWIALESEIVVCSRRYWLWDLLDSRSGFLLDFTLTPNRVVEGADLLAQSVLRNAAGLYSASPPVRLKVFNHGCFETADSPSSTGGPAGTDPLIDRLEEILRSRLAMLQAQKTPDNTRLIIRGFAVNHNYFTRLACLNNRSPAQAAGISFNYSCWTDVVRGLSGLPSANSTPPSEPGNT